MSAATTPAPEEAASRRPMVGVQAAVFRDSHVLLQRRANVFGSGTWGLPGGHLEFGESFEQAAGRELAEECGLRALEMRTVLPHNTAYASTHYVQIAVEVLEWDGEPEIREPERCSDLGFFSLTKLPQPLFEPSVRILDHLSSRSHTEAAQHSLSLSLILTDRHGRSLKRVAYMLLLGNTGVGIQRIFTPDRHKPKSTRMNRFRTPDDAWSWLRRQLGNRLSEGYFVQDCRGDAPLDRVLEVFPTSHPVALQSLNERCAPTVDPHQLTLLPEQSGW